MCFCVVIGNSFRLQVKKTSQGKRFDSNRQHPPTKSCKKMIFVFNLSRSFPYSSLASALNVFCVVIGNSFRLQVKKTSQDKRFDSNRQHPTIKNCKKMIFVFNLS